MSSYIKIKGVSVLLNLAGAQTVSLRKNYNLDDDRATYSIVLVFYDGGSYAVVDDIESTADAENIADSITSALKEVRTQPI